MNIGKREEKQINYILKIYKVDSEEVKNKAYENVKRYAKYDGEISSIVEKTIKNKPIEELSNDLLKYEGPISEITDDHVTFMFVNI
jgi:hypothetical protein